MGVAGGVTDMSSDGDVCSDGVEGSIFTVVLVCSLLVARAAWDTISNNGINHHCTC